METYKQDVGLSKAHIDLGEKIEAALKKVSGKLIAEEKKNNGYLIVSDKLGNIKRIVAKDI